MLCCLTQVSLVKQNHAAKETRRHGNLDFLDIQYIFLPLDNSFSVSHCFRYPGSTGNEKSACMMLVITDAVQFSFFFLRPQFKAAQTVLQRWYIYKLDCLTSTALAGILLMAFVHLKVKKQMYSHSENIVEHLKISSEHCLRVPE